MNIVKRVSSYCKPVVFVFLVALLIRAAFFINLLHSPDRMWRSDSVMYLTPAVNILRGNGYSMQKTPSFTPTARVPPVYPLFIASLYSVLGQNSILIPVAQIIIGACTASLTYIIARRVLNGSQALLAGLLFAFSLAPVIHNMYILSETLFSFLLLLSTFLLLTYRQERRLAYLAGAGLLAGLTALCRHIALPYLALVAAWIFLVTFVNSYNRWRAALVQSSVFLLAAILCIAPWIYRNYRLLSIPAVSTVTNVNLLYYNAVSVEARVQGVSEEKVRERLLALANINPSKPILEITPEQYHQCGQLGTEIILKHPWRYIYIHLKSDLIGLLPDAGGTLRFIGIQREFDNSMDVFRKYGLFKALQNYFGNSLIGTLVILYSDILLGTVYAGVPVGSVFLIRRRKWPELSLLLLTAAYFLIIPGPVSNARFRVPVMPYLCMGSSAGLAVLAAQLRKHRAPETIP